MSQSEGASMLSFADVEAASARLAGVAHRTPVLQSATMNKRAGAQLFFKAENFQRVGAFKFRGAYNALARFTPEQRKGGVITYSSGNHAQAIALAAALLKMPSVIVMPKDAPASKLAATRGYQEEGGVAGSEVVLYDRFTQDREQITKDLAKARGMTIIPPYDHVDVMAGQGTATKELLEEVGPLDYLFVCCGGGGLLSGACVAAAALSPSCKVYGVEPLAGNDTQQSLALGHIVHIATPVTIADGAQTQHSGQLTFPVIQKHVAGILTVTDEQLVETMRLFAERMKIVVEPTGCLGTAAALFSKDVDVRGKRIGVIISGGNVDLDKFSSFINPTK